MSDPIELRLFDDAEVYSLDELNDVVRSYASNDDRLKDLVDSLMGLLTTVTQPTGNVVQTPAQVEATIDQQYDLANTGARTVPLAPGDLPRYYQEVVNLLKLQPFSDLLAGVALNAPAQVTTLKVFTVLKGLLYWVVDGPNYEAEPDYVKEGSLFMTTLSRPAASGGVEYLMVDEHGEPALVGSAFVYRPMPLGPVTIPLIDFWLNRIMVRKLRTLYRLSAFEAGVDARYANDSAWRFVEQAFVFDETGTPNERTTTQRYPCGFVSPGAFRFLREDAAVYAPTADLSHLIPGSGAPDAGVEDRVVMDECYVQLPFGLIRIPRSLLSWGQLITDAERLRTSLGDPVVFVGLKAEVSVVERDSLQVEPMAEPAEVGGSGFLDAAAVTASSAADGSITLLSKTVALPFTNVPPLSGTQAERLAVLGGAGHQHGLLVGFQQSNVLSPTSTAAQFAQITVSLVVTVLRSKTVADALAANNPAGLRDEASALDANGTDLDEAPWRTFSATPRNVLPLVAAAFPSYDADLDQVALAKVEDVVSPAQRTLSVILPLALHLAKDPSRFTTDNLNGCDVRLADAWAIRRVFSAQSSMNTIALDDGLGAPEAFPTDFIGCRATFIPADGTPTLQGTILGRLGDQLAVLPEGFAAKLKAGDVVVLDQRQPEASLNGTYLREVSRDSLVDARAKVARLVSATVRETAETSPLTSPLYSPSPAQPTYELVREKPPELAEAALAAYASMTAAIEGKVRYHIGQRFFGKAADRHDLVNLRTDADGLKAFLLTWIAEYDRNKDHEYTLGENVLIHWPEKSARTVVPLTRYQRVRLLDQEDELAVEEVEGWGPVPTLTKYLRGQEYTRYPIRFDATLTFIPDRAFNVPGHTKLGGTFFLRPDETQVVDPIIHVTLYQTRTSGNVTKRVFLGSVDLDYRFPDSFKNATGVFLIDDEARYEPTTQRLSINYNQTLNFSNDEPGELTLSYVYNDLTQIHPLWHFVPGDYGVSVSHLASAEGLVVSAGKVEAIPDLVMRLEGVSINGGEAVMRWQKEDCFAVLAKGGAGAIRTKWVLRDLPFIVINSVTYDAAGKPSDVDYSAKWVDRNQTTTTQITNDTRCRQRYEPCALKYGWVDSTQSNIHTEANPIRENASFGFYELRDFLVDGALDVDALVRGALYVLDREPLDYRFTQPLAQPASPDLEAVASAAVLFDPTTGARRALVGVFRQAADQGSSVTLTDELTLADVTRQDAVYLRRGDLTADWVLEFAGMLVMAEDDASLAQGATKLCLAGRWYGGHPLADLVGRTTLVGVDAILFDLGGLAGSPEDLRIGDVPQAYAYRGSNLLHTARKRPV